MAYRNGTYVAFHANGRTEPTESDIKYYNLLKAWRVRDDDDFTFVDSHEKTGAIRDSSTRATVARSLRTRLNNSRNMILVIGATTREDSDWVPLEIEHAIDSCEIPIIAASAPADLAWLWPAALRARIRSGAAHVIHAPFRKEPLRDAVPRFGPGVYPAGGGLGYYSAEAYRAWGLR